MKPGFSVVESANNIDDIIESIDEKFPVGISYSKRSVWPAGHGAMPFISIERNHPSDGPV